MGEPRTLPEVLLGRRHVPGAVGFAIIFAVVLAPPSLLMLGFGIYHIVHGADASQVVVALCLLGVATACALIALGWRIRTRHRRSGIDDEQLATVDADAPDQ